MINFEVIELNSPDRKYQTSLNSQLYLYGGQACKCPSPGRPRRLYFYKLFSKSLSFFPLRPIMTLIISLSPHMPACLENNRFQTVATREAFKEQAQAADDSILFHIIRED